MNPLWQAGIIAAIIAAFASIVVAILGRRSSQETNAVAFSEKLMKKVEELEKTATAANTKADAQERRVGRLERVLDAAIDHIMDWEDYHANGDEGSPPDQARVLKEFRDRRNNGTEEKT